MNKEHSVKMPSVNTDSVNMEMHMNMGHEHMEHMHHMEHEHMEHEHMSHEQHGHEHLDHAAHVQESNNTRQRPVSDGSASATVVVNGGYSPSTVEVKAGEPVRLVFDRQEEGDCSSHVVFKQLDVNRALPAYQQTTLDLGTLEPGEYPFACGMNMLHGVLKVS